MFLFHLLFEKRYGRKTAVDYIRMIFTFYGFACELVTQTILAGDLGFVEKGGLGATEKDIAETERMLKVLIQSLENKYLNPWTLFFI